MHAGKSALLLRYVPSLIIIITIYIFETGSFFAVLNVLELHM